ncbi:hypothetical protein LEP1GSC061_0002 [Leptospira wolffii serovar Khorat str. Khorat-H2]|nr:hypothetical protein LEP1GSC061_0002 [Leptospira wolffii serovar Khorat str. Khorat-H2]
MAAKVVLSCFYLERTQRSRFEIDPILETQYFISKMVYFR